MNTCPECAANVDVPADVKAGEILFCGECKSELEVLSLAPIAIALAPEIEEDWGE